MYPMIRRLVLLTILLPLVAFAQEIIGAPPPSGVGGILRGFLTPGGLASAVAVVGGILAGFQFFTAKRKKLLAIASYYAFHVVEDIGNEIEGDDGFDKTAKFLKVVDEYMVSKGYRPLKPGEVEGAKIEASALHGAEVAKAKVAEAGAVALAGAANPSKP